MTLILELLNAIFYWQNVMEPKKTNRRIRSARRTSRGFMIDYVR